MFVIGAPPTSGRGPVLPMMAPVASDGMVAGIRRMVAGETAVPFTYRTGMLATIGRNAAVAHIRGVSFHGFPA